MVKENKTVWILCAIIILILLSSFIIIIWKKTDDSGGKYAQIYQNGKLVREIDLNAVEESYTFEIIGENGATNVIEVRKGEIGMKSANCPDYLCVDMGFISSGNIPVTCLPNHIVIKITSEASEQETFDAVVY